MKSAIAAVLLVTTMNCFAAPEQFPPFLEVGATYLIGTFKEALYPAKILKKETGDWYYIESQLGGRSRYWINISRCDTIKPMGR